MRIGTRGSALALAQARLVADLLGGAELVTITTTGDRATPSSPQHDQLRPDQLRHDQLRHDRTDTSIQKPPGEDKSRWVLELEQALTAGEIDLAVHSAKDVPGELADGLTLLGSPARADAQDVLVGVGSFELLETGAKVGTSSVRRVAQQRAAREDLEVVALRGNVDTRLGKLDRQNLQAIVLARAGLQRLGREDEVGVVLDPERFVPSPGQGALAIEGRDDDERASAAVQAITDTGTFACLRAERAVAGVLGATCHTPLGAYAAPLGRDALHLHAWVGLPDGSAWLSDELAGDLHEPVELGRRVAERLRAVGAQKLLERAEKMTLGRA
jgi:hydroxymethylbilane synthase